MPQRGRVTKVTTSVCVWTTTVGAAIKGQHPEPVVLGSRRVNVNLNFGAGGGVGARDTFL